MPAEAVRSDSSRELVQAPPPRDSDEGLLRLPTDRAPADHLPTVLVVDDDIFVCRAVSCILREARRVQVYAARNGDEALQLAPEILPDLVILDIKMPGATALDVCRGLREHPELEHTRICLLTGIMADPGMMQELEPYLDEVMTKPPDPRALVALVDAG